MSAASLAGTSPIVAPVAGFTTASVAPLDAWRQSPPMKLELREDSSEDMTTDCHAATDFVAAG
jgi:hypothetical protein